MGEDRRRAWITGIGPVSPLGAGRERFRSGLASPGAAFGLPPPSPDGLEAPGPAATLAGAGFQADDHVDPRYTRRLSAFSRWSLAAAGLALDDAAFPSDPDLRNATGVVLGTAFGSTGYHFEYYEGLFRRGLKEASPLLFSESVLNAASGHISQYFGLRGPGVILVGGEDVGIAAVASALDQLRAGTAPAFLAGGAEEYCPIIHRALVHAGIVAGRGIGEAARERALGADLGAWWRMRAGNPPRGAAPFGEGAAVLVLEDEEAARRRGARALACVVGAGWGRAGPEEARAGVPAARAVEEACRDGGIDPASVDLVVGSAGEDDLDGPEIAGLRSVLDPARSVALLLPKTVLGEGFGYSSSAQVLIAALCIAAGEVVPCGGDGPRAVAARHALAIATTRRGGACAVLLGVAHG